MFVADMHCDTIFEIDRKFHKGNPVDIKDSNLNISLNKMKQGDYVLQNFALFTPLKHVEDPIQHVMHLIDTFYLELEKYPEIIGIVKSYKDIEDNIHNNKMSAMMTLEEGGVVNNDLSYLRNYYRLGVRMITLTWNYVNGIGYPNFDVNDESHGFHTCDEKNGLTEFGVQYVKECERLGILIDVSHLSDAGFYDVMKHTSKPFVASHSNARALCDHARNMSDDMIICLAARGGVMGINFASDFLKEGDTLSRVSSMVEHILYIKNLAGIDCIGLGSDFDGIPQNLELKDASYMPVLYQALQNAGLSEEEIEKVFYKNVLRVYKEVLK